ncbi:Uncharacterised protein [Pseudomonas aeruginosa]|nr:Uncharacterised protein [Pseudomonas aeruginosa]
MITTLTFSSGVVFSALKINGPGGKITLPAAFSWRRNSPSCFM